MIDGKSKDGTVDIMNDYKSIITKYISEPDKGLYDAMNRGIELATGDLVGILNSDDVFTDHTILEKIARFHTENDIEASVGNILQSE